MQGIREYKYCFSFSLFDYLLSIYFHFTTYNNLSNSKRKTVFEKNTTYLCRNPDKFQ